MLNIFLMIFSSARIALSDKSIFLPPCLSLIYSLLSIIRILKFDVSVDAIFFIDAIKIVSTIIVNYCI